MFRPLALSFCLLVCACTGQVVVPSLGGLLPGTPEPPSKPTEPDGPLPFSPAPAALKRLTRVQYGNAVRDVLGANLTIPALEPDTFSYHFANIGAADTSIGPSSAEKYDDAAFAIAAQVTQDAALRTQLVGSGCVAMAAEPSCQQMFFDTIGRRLWRRPVDSDERARLTKLISDGQASFGDVWKGYERALAAMLASPHFLYRVELGDESGHYTGLELASRLAFFIHGTTPDDALLDAAIAGELDTDEGLARQVDRLLADPKARASLGQFFTEHLGLQKLDGLLKPTFPLSTPTLGVAMRRELELIVDELVFTQKTDVRRLWDSDLSFVDAELASFYGYGAAVPPDAKGFVKLNRPTTDPRAGLLSTAGFLAMSSGQTMSSPTHRGKFIKLSVLCEEIPPPPPGVVTELPPPEPGETTRQRSERHESIAQCAGCHALMDPLGYALEGFDALGASRQTDNGSPVNTRTVVGGVELNGARELATVLASHERVGPCLSRELYRYATSHVNLDTEDIELIRIGETFAADGHHFETLVKSIAMSQGFRQAGAGQ